METEDDVCDTGILYRWEYDLSGSTIIRARYYNDGELTAILLFIYDENGAPIGMSVKDASSGTAKTYYYEKNLQGDIVGVLNEAGYKVVSYTYDAWGNPYEPGYSYTSGVSATDRDNVKLNPFRYRGYYYDAETGYYYLQTRYYNPEWGRFLNADSALYNTMLGFNLFAYCYNNPINCIDKNGENAAQLLEEWYQCMPAVSSIDGPYPVADFIWLLGAIVLTVIVTVETIFASDPASDIVPNDRADESPKVIEEKEKYDPNPYKRPGEKKQNRENRNKSRRSDDWKPRNNRRSGKPAKPKKHTPGRDHKKVFL